MRISDWSSDVCSSDLGARKTYRSHGKEQEKHGITRHIDRKTAITADLTGVQSIINYANTQEKRAGDQAVAQHNHHRALNALLIESKQACGNDRSEEHTSELQSLMRISYAVFCLKKKKKNTTDNTNQV